MGSCCSVDNADDTGSIGSDLGPVQDTWHQNILRNCVGKDVFLKYTQISVLGKGSMGHIVKVEVRQSQRGGIAFYQQRQQSMAMKQRQQQQSSSSPGSPKRKRFGSFTELTRRLSRQPKREPDDNSNKPDKDSRNNSGGGDTTTAGKSAVDKRRKNQVFYALKSIILDRVSPVMMEELRNEIDILKGMVRNMQLPKFAKSMSTTLSLSPLNTPSFLAFFLSFFLFYSFLFFSVSIRIIQI